MACEAKSDGVGSHSCSPCTNLASWRVSSWRRNRCVNEAETTPGVIAGEAVTVHAMYVRGLRRGGDGQAMPQQRP